MDTRSGLIFNKCFCCSKNFNVSQLIELNTNSVVIGEEMIAFVDLILDICLLEVFYFFFLLSFYNETFILG